MRFKATATVCWNFDTQLSQNEALELANKYLGDLPTQDGISDLKFVVRVDKLKEKVEKIKLGEFQIDEVMPFINKDDGKKEYEYEGTKYLVKMNSHRYFIFRECMSCVACGLPGTKMFLECHPADQSPHFNLYGEEDGKLILMTKDHIHARAFGGEDRHSNYQTMCLTCNHLKGHSNLTLEDIREMRNIFNENKNKVNKKKLHSLIEETRAKLEQPWPSAKLSGTQRKKQLATLKATFDAVMTTCDINLYFGKEEICGRSVYDSIDVGNQHIGCIKKGTCLEPLAATREKVMCKLSDQDVVVLHHSLVKEKDKSGDFN